MRLLAFIALAVWRDRRRGAAQRGAAPSAPPRAAAASRSGPIVGLIAGTSQWQDLGMAGRLNQVVSASDTKWLREGFYWERIEPKPGAFTFAHYDKLVIARGATPRAPAGSSCTWLLSGRPRRRVRSPPIRRPTRRYVAAVVAPLRTWRDVLGCHIRTWPAMPIQTFEIWNEAYYTNGDGGHYNPGRYARLVKAAATAGRAANPAAKFLDRRRDGR